MHEVCEALSTCARGAKGCLGVLLLLLCFFWSLSWSGLGQSLSHPPVTILPCIEPPEPWPLCIQLTSQSCWLTCGQWWLHAVGLPACPALRGWTGWTGWQVGLAGANGSLQDGCKQPSSLHRGTKHASAKRQVVVSRPGGHWVLLAAGLDEVGQEPCCTPNTTCMPSD
jgi:hypothetical protein